MAKKKKTAKKSYTAQSARNSRERGKTIRRVLTSLGIIIIVVLTISMLVLRNESELTLAENSIGSLLTPVQSALTSATQGVKDFFTNWRNYGKLQEDYEALERENQQLSLELSNADEAMLENERLKGLLDAKTSYESLDPIYARVIARDAGQWFTTFTINRGEMHGVSNGMAIVNGDGLVGHIYEVGLNYAKVLSIIDPNSGLACLVQRTRDNGIMRGGITATADKAECYVYYLPNVNNIMPGDVIVTSGTDSLYPKGLTIGTVTQISLDAGAEGNFAVVSPAVDFLRIEEVLVLRNVVEKPSDTASDVLPSMPTATPSPTVTPAPTQTTGEAAVVSPDATDEIWSYPVPGEQDAEPIPNPIVESLPEDSWIESTT